MTFTPLMRYNFVMSSMINNLSAAQLKRAVAIKEQIEKLETELSSIQGESGKSAPSAVPVVATKKRTMSAAAKAKISAAQKARWAKERGEPAPRVSDKSTPKPEKALKIVGRNKIVPGIAPRGKSKKEKTTLEW